MGREIEMILITGFFTSWLPHAPTKYSSMTYHFPAVLIVPTCDKEALTPVTMEDIEPERAALLA